jgi:PAS domain S-box-containing protein
VTFAHTDALDFRALFEASPGLYLVLSPTFTIVGASDGYLRATLTRREDILSRWLFDVFPANPENLTALGASQLRESLERVLRSGAPDVMKLQRHNLRRGEAAGGGFEQRLWNETNSPVFGSDKEIKYIIHRVEDVTDAVRLERAGLAASPRPDAPSNGGADFQAPLLPGKTDPQDVAFTVEASEDQPATKEQSEIRALFDSLPLLAWTARPDGFRDFHNRRWYEYSGTTCEQMRGWGWRTVHDPRFLPLVMARWSECIRSETPFEMEFPLRRHDGVFRWFLTRACPVRDADNNLIRWVGINTDIDDQKQAARAAEEVHSAILGNMSEGVCMVRVADNTIVYTNAKFELMLGYGPRELLGKLVADITTTAPEQFHTVDEVIGELHREGQANYEVALLRKDGATVWCRARATRLETPSFGPVWVGVHEDITQRRAAEEERDSFFEMSRDLLCIGTFDGQFKRLNAAWERILGWTREELMSRGLLAFVHPEDQQATGQAMSQGQQLVSFENRYRCKDGTYRWLQWTGLPIVERGLFYAAARDVTESRASKEALLELSESLETTLQSIGDGVIATDAKGAVTRMNPVAERLTGWTLPEARNKPFAEVFKVVDEDTRAKVADPIERTLREDVTVGLPKRTVFVRRDGSEVAIADSCAPIRTADGSVNGAVLVFRDLTNERNAAKIQARFQQQLVFADRMASVGTLAAGVAHEINNPLTYITANIDTAIEEIRALVGGSPSGVMKDLEEVLIAAREGATRVTKIVRGLKTFSRIDEERLGVVDLIPVLELSVNMAFNEIRHRARLVKDYGTVPLVHADDARLGQVFINLLVNAAQALPEGKTDANEIRIVTSTDGAGRALIDVQDNGPGMTQDLMTHIFDPFFTTKAVGVGTGLGLAICRNIITGMGGDISVQSEVGVGTTFRVALPASRDAISVGTAAQDCSTPSFRLAHVLVIDDEPSVGIAVRRVLRKHEVTVVTTAEAALDLLSGGRNFDIILSDLMMPGMSGIDFYAALVRTHPKMASRVVFVTGGAFTPEANAFLDRVTNERLEKPFDIKQLRDLVQKFVKNPEPEFGQSLAVAAPGPGV